MNDRKQPQSRNDSNQPQSRNDSNQPSGQEGASKQERNPSVIEWLVGGIAMLLVLTGIGFLAYAAWRGTSSPPLLNVRAHKILPQPMGGYVVEIIAANQGGTTARGVVIEGRLLNPDGERGSEAPDNQQGGKGSGNQQGNREVEQATTTLSWVPAHAERAGGLFFSHDPRQYRLEIQPKGYDRP